MRQQSEWHSGWRDNHTYEYRYRVVTPTAFKVGDIVEAVVALVCFPTGKGGGAKMSIALRGLSLLDRTERDVSPWAHCHHTNCRSDQATESSYLAHEEQTYEPSSFYRTRVKEKISI